MGGRLGVGLGSAVKVGPFAGGSAFEVNTLGEFYTRLGFESRLLFPLRVHFDLRNKVYQINGKRIVAPPYTVLGVRSSMELKNARMDFGLRTNSFTTLVSLVELVQEEQLPRLFEIFSPAIGIDLKFE